MSRLELYKGYRALIAELYDFRNYRRRTLEFILNRGAQVGARRAVRDASELAAARAHPAGDRAARRARAARGSRCR